MKQLVVALSALFLSIVLFASGNAFVNSLLGVRMTKAGIDPMTIGAVLFFFALGFVIGSRHSQKIIQRVGHIRAFAVFSAAIAIASMAYPLSSSMITWSILRFASGIAAAGLLMTVESWFSCVASQNNRATLFATYQICFYSAVAGGQLLLQVAPPETATPFTMAAMLLVASLIPLALSRMHSPTLESIEAMPIREVFREAPLGIIATVINGILMSGFYAMAPVFTTGSGLSVAQTSIYMATAILSAMALAWPIGYICDRRDRARVMLIVTLVAASASVLILAAGSMSFALLCGFTSVYFGLSASIYAIAVAITHDRMSHSQIVAASAALLTAYGLGSLIGPLLNAALMSISGPESFFVVNTCLLLVLMGFILRDIQRVPAITPDAQENFVPISPDVFPVMTEIDPRNDEFNEEDKPIEDLFDETQEELA
ncbi:MAG: MFS family permease [Bermanella sp.]|jgi:MFS family permease